MEDKDNLKLMSTGSSKPIGPAPALNKEEMDKVLREVQIKAEKKRLAREDACYQAKMDQVLSNMKNKGINIKDMKPEWRAVLTDAIKLEGKQFCPGKLVLKSDKDKGKEKEGK